VADDVTFQTTVATPPTGTVVATDQVGTKHYQKIKLFDGTAESEVAAKVSSEGNLQTITPNRTASAVLGALNAAVTLSTDGSAVAVFQCTAVASLLGEVTFEGTADGSNWVGPLNVGFYQTTPTQVVTNPLVGDFWVLTVGAFTSVRARMRLYTSGSVTIAASAAVSDTQGSTPGYSVLVDGNGTGGVAQVIGSRLQVGNALAANLNATVKLTDGTNTASVRDTGASDSLNVAIVDAAGNQITSFGGGTQYAEDSAHVSGDSLTLAGVVQQTADAALSTDGDRSLLQVDATGYLKANIKAGTVSANLNAGTNNIGDVDVLTIPAPLSTTGAGTEAAALRVTLATDSTGLVSVDDNGGSLTVDGTVAVTGVATAAEQATQTASLAAIESDVDALRISSQLLDDTINTLGTATYTEATTRGSLIGVVRRDADTSAVNLDNEIAPLQVDALGRLKVEAFSGETLPVSLTSTTVTAISAGDNNIGNVDVVTLPALVAGSANIGDVDVLTVPAPLSTSGGGTEATALRVTLATDSTGVVSVDDNGGALTVDGTVSVSGAVDTELPAAAALADGVANPTVPTVGAFASVFNGTTWDRVRGDTLGVNVSRAAAAATAATSTVPGSASSVTLLALNAARKGAAFHNDSTALLYLKLGTTASTSDFTVKMVPEAHYEAPYGYTGRVDGIWASATGNARVTELT